MAKEETVSKETATDQPAEKKSLKERWHRIKPTKRNVDRGQRALSRHIRKFLVRRWDNLRLARREVIGWLVLVAVLVMIGCLQTLLYTRGTETTAAVDGGTYAEGIVDKIVTINPLYTVTDGERAVSSLIYAGLLGLDETGRLRPELATSYSISQDGKTYSVKLRDNVRWSDGQNFTADDVVLTVELMKNPTVGSALLSTWKNIEVKKIDDSEVAFTLRSVSSSFPFALNFGILPAHIMKEIKPTDIRNTFNDNPAKVVGTGAFVFRGEEALANGQTVLRLAANDRYFRGAPRINNMTIQTYATSEDLLKGFIANEISAAADLGTREAALALKQSGTNLIQTPLGDGVFAMFNNKGEITSDLAVREALRLGIDRSAARSAVTDQVDDGAELATVSALETPLLPNLVYGVAQLRQPDYDLEAAAEKLDAAGWKLDDNGQRVKDGRPLTLSVVTVRDTDYEPAAQNLAEQWRRLGIEIDFTAADPSSAQQNYFIPRSYDVLVYQLHLGADPDVAAYWASSQATARGLNFANYNSTLADLALTNARTQLNQERRNARYVDFAKQWLKDAPAIALYQPMYYYLTDTGVHSLTVDDVIFDNISRFSGARDFTVNIGKVKTTP
ncbi:peptide ABC transporter substrate-binding protein [Candidatus Saccharibacteria bacterium]|nr:peptide ABC transporter substrate-binding protein [Candidatus Saccharibacteria bacterium]